MNSIAFIRKDAKGHVKYMAKLCRDRTFGVLMQQLLDRFLAGLRDMGDDTELILDQK